MNNNLKVLITPQAQKDILKIVKYISKDNKKAALKINDSFRKTFEMIGNFPLSGTPREAILNQSIRIYTIKKQYAIAYRINEKQVEIIRVLTRYQDIFAIL